MSNINRRIFLQSSAGAAAALLATGAAPGQPNRAPAITFGFSLYGMRSLTLENALQACDKIGYNAVELALMPNWPADPARLNRAARTALRDRLQQLHLALPALMENLPLHVDDATHRRQLDRLRRATELGRELSPKTQPIIETVLGGRDGQWNKLRDQFARRLGEWATIAQRARTVVCIKPHRGGAMNTPEHALWLHQRVNNQWIKLAYDYSHFQHRNITLAASLKAMVAHTRFVHVKDVRVQNGRTQFLLPGAGTIDYATLLRQLVAANYRGCVCVEVSGQIHGRKGYDPAATARTCFANLAPAFRRAGIRL